MGQNKQSFLTRVMMEFGNGGHSIFAPSSSSRWLKCAYSLIANLFEHDETSFEAAEGTIAHGIAEDWLVTGIRPLHLVGTVQTLTENGVTHEIPITRTMIDYIQEYVDWCRFEEGTMFTESRVYFTDLMPRANTDDPDAEPIPFLPQGGTADNIIIRDRTLIVTDLKYGKGVQVFAEGNPQAMLYAYGAYLEYKDRYDFDAVIIRIAQPRLDHFDTWEITIDELLEFVEYVRVRAEIAWSIDAPRKATVEGCRFCRAAHNCPALAYVMECAIGGDTEFLDAEFGEYEMSVLRDALAKEYKFRRAKIGQLTTKEMAKILPYRKVIENWFSRLDYELEARALKGEEIPGQKLVESRTNRRFRSDEEAKELLSFLGLDEDKYMETKILSPTKLEDVLRQEMGLSRAGAPAILESVVIKPEGKPTLAPLTDKRPPISGKYSGAFDDEDDEDDDV